MIIVGDAGRTKEELIVVSCGERGETGEGIVEPPNDSVEDGDTVVDTAIGDEQQEQELAVCCESDPSRSDPAEIAMLV